MALGQGAEHLIEVASLWAGRFYQRGIDYYKTNESP